MMLDEIINKSAEVNDKIVLSPVADLNSVGRSTAAAKAMQAAQMALVDQDLVTASQPDRNWRGIIIAVLVIASVCALIVTSVVLLTPPDDGPRVKGRRFELEDIFGPEFQPLRMNGTWLSRSDHKWIYRDFTGGVSILDVHNMTTRLLVNSVTFKRFNAVSFSFSSDLKFILFTHDVQKVHRYSYLAKYTLFEINTGETKPITIDSTITSASTYSTLQLVKWSPVGDSLILVHQGDIYYKEKPKGNTMFRITDSARPDVIFNGIPDWLYEEEILGSNSAMWFAQDGHALLFLTFNDSLVGEHHLLHYGSYENPYLYPKVKTLRYPKPGTKNPIVDAWICDLRQGFKSVSVEPPEGISTMEYYITAAGWIHNTHVGIVWTSRSFNLSIISICTASNGSCEEVYRVAAERRGWVEAIHFPLFSTNPNSKNFITIAPMRDGENGFFDHLVYVDTINKRSHPLTHGSYDVIKTNAWDEENKLIYFTATPASHPGERRLYRIRMVQPYTEHSPDCLSCGPVAGPGSHQNFENSTFSYTAKAGTKTGAGKGNVGQLPEESLSTSSGHKGNVMSREESVSSNGLMLGSNKSCSFVSNVKFSPTKSYFIVECAGPDIPFVALYASTITPSTNNLPPIADIRLIQILQHNEALEKSSKKMAFPQVRTFTVHMTGGHNVRVRLLLPPGLREDEITKYPLLLNVYGGPGSQLVLDRWTIDFTTYLASKKDYIVAQVDSRGSGGRGWDFQHKVFLKLGINEAADQIEVIRYLRDSLHFVDSKSIAVWGWSYGGYLTAMIMNSKMSKDVFRCGASIAPVSNWKLYDSAYTEKYMGTPNVTDNYKGYEDSDVTRNVEQFADKMFYLVHGTADDNVHIQHSMLLAKALIAKKITFRQQVYPDEPHGLSGVKLHVHKSLEIFFEDCFRKQARILVPTLKKEGKVTNDAI